MTNETLRQSLISQIDAFCEREGISPTAFGIAAVGNKHFVFRLRENKVTSRNMEEAEMYMRRYRDRKIVV